MVGRKGWLFSDTPADANASAIIYSMVETAKANGLDPYAWLRRVMRELPAARTVEEDRNEQDAALQEDLPR